MPAQPRTTVVPKAVFALVVLGSLAGCEQEQLPPSDTLKTDPMAVRAVAVIRDDKGRPVCNGVMLAPDIAATDAHCLSDKPQTISVLQPNGKWASSAFAVLLKGSPTFAVAFSTHTPGLYTADHAEMAADQAIVKLEKPVADAGAVMQVATINDLQWTPLEGTTTLMTTDIKLATRHRIGKGTASNLLVFDCKLVKSTLLDMVVSHTCPTKGGSSGGALYTEGAKGAFMLVALHTGTVSPDPHLESNPPFNMVGFEYAPMLRRLDNGFSLELYDISDGNKLTERYVRTGVLAAPLADECKKTKPGCNIP